jgi:uncharacterized protein (TIGR04255 family)
MNKISPINQNHSIKEAVISVFLASPIIKPERFKKVIESTLSDSFQKFETISQITLELKNQNGFIKNIGQQVANDRGFRFSSFEKGNLSKILQGVNESNRTFISYHSLKYERWAKFHEEYTKYITAISEYQSDLFVTAISLHYVDEFLWETPNVNDLADIFNSHCSYLPGEFFNSIQTQYSIVVQKDLESGMNYSDRLEIKLDGNSIRPLITISHNVTHILKEITDLKGPNLINHFSKLLEPAHLHNKELLKCILKPDILNCINLI